MTSTNPCQQALDAGFTREVFATSDNYDFYLLIRPETDLDGRFKAYDTDSNEWLRINGWLFTFEDATGHCIGPHDGIMRREA